MWLRVGVLSMVVSVVPYLLLALAPFLGLSLGSMAGAVAIALILAEVLFWCGLALAGRDTWTAIKSAGWRGAPRELVDLLVRGRPAHGARVGGG